MLIRGERTERAFNSSSGRIHLGTVAGFVSVQWPASNRNRWPDCVGIRTLVVTPDGLPLGYEVLPGNTADRKTLRDFRAKIEEQYGKARRIWVMDRGVPTEDTLA